MSATHDQEQGYRRGLVLGLTMAEIAVLVIFVLLLIFGTLFARQTNETDTLRDQVNTLEAAALELERIAQDLGQEPEVVMEELARARASQERLEQIEREAERLRILERELELVRPQEMANQPLPEVFRELVLVRDAIKEAGVSTSPEELAETLNEAEAAREALGNLPEDTRSLGEQNVQLSRENQNLKSQMANLRRQAQRAGRGLDHPPCWATPSGRAEYIFDVALTSRGFIIRDRNLPHRAEDRAELPIEGIAFGTELPSSRFLSMTRPLHQWSLERDCRFVVKAFDTTGPDEKATYKRRMGTLEQHFYKFEPRNERF